MRGYTAMLVAGAVLLAGCGEELIHSGNGPGSGAARRLAVSLRYSGPVYQGNFYHGFLPPSDHVVWIEDSQGTYIKTLEISRAAVTFGSHGSHISHLPAWAASSGESDSLLMARTDTGSIAVEYDGITAASTKFYNAAKNDTNAIRDTTRIVMWDFTDAAGQRVADGVYRFCAETANIKKDSLDTDPYPPDSILHEHCCATVSLVDSAVHAATPTAHILGLTAIIEY